MPKVRIDFWADDVVRIWLSADGSFSYYNPDNIYLIQPGLDRFSGPLQFAISDAGAYIKLQSLALTVRVQKAPFGLAFYRADNQTLIAATPAGLSLDTDVKAWLQRDACGQAEHFFGLQFESAPVSTLDRRGDIVSVEDKNGYGWPAPFMMSSAGYGLFFHNEDGQHTRFTLTDPVVLENTVTNGQADLFFLYGPDFKHLLDLYTDITGKPPMPPKKLMGFQYLVQGTPMTNEEAFPDWVSRGYPIDSCITFTDAQVETPSEVAAVAAAAEQIHARNGLFGFYYDVLTPGTFRLSRPEPTTPPHTNWTALSNLLKTRLLDNGVDWFWIDDTDDYWPPRFNFSLCRVVAASMETQDTRRGFVCARGGYAGCQRFAYPWMGDLGYDRATVLANLCNGLIGVPFSTHDMAGAGLFGKSEPQFLAGVKASFLNPFPQCNSWIPGQYPCQRPWEWSELAENVFHRFDGLHYQLIPYFYNTAWQAHKTGMPVWRALLLEYPNNPDYYASDEILIGDWLLMAPLYTQPYRTVDLPAGKWRYLFEDTEYVGPCSLTSFNPTIDQYPIFLKAGAILPLAPVMRYVDEVPADLTLLIYPSGTSTYTIYEDDGKTRDYLTGAYATTRVECVDSAPAVDITLHARQGGYVPPPRHVLLKVLSSRQPAEVRLGGVALPRLETLDALAGVTQAWCYAVDDLTGAFQAVVKLPDAGTNTVIGILRNPAAPSPPRQMGHVVFTKTDRLTHAAWPGVYGSGGYWLPGDSSHLACGNPVLVAGNQLSVGVAGCAPAPVSLYLLDQNPGGVATIKASDRATGRLLDSRTLTNAESGVYLNYEITRAADFTISNQPGSTVQLAGVFFDGPTNVFCDFDAPAAATFLEEDRWTQGDWTNRYGSLSYSVVAAGESLTNGFVLQYGGTPFVWGSYVAGLGALQMPGQSGRIAACRYGVTFNVDVGVKGAEAKVVSLYFLDWDSGGQRALSIKLLDPNTCEVYDTRPLCAFNGGVYLRYAVKGHIRFELNKTAGANAVVSGCFEDPPLTAFQQWQITYFGSASHPDAAPTADPDGDGLENQTEFAAGTDPTTALPPLWITGVKPEAAGVRLTWYATGNQTNIVQCTTNLGAAGFADLSGLIELPPCLGFVTNYLDPLAATNAAARFYRIRRLP
jgi:hypothetical protein